MRKVILQMMITVDGFFEGPNREIDWHNVDAEFNEYAVAFLDTLDGFIFGRVTYDLMAGYWASADALKDDPLVAQRMNSLRKIVASRTLKKVDWNNSVVYGDNIVEEITKLKSEPGKDFAVFGSSDLALTLIEHNLIDEFRIMVNPMVLGSGKRLFQGIKGRLGLKLLETKTFKSGNVMLRYVPKPAVS